MHSHSILKKVWIHVKAWNLGFKDCVVAWNWALLHPNILLFRVNKVTPCLQDLMGCSYILTFIGECCICEVSKTLKRNIYVTSSSSLFIWFTNYFYPNIQIVIFKCDFYQYWKWVIILDYSNLIKLHKCV